MKNCITFIIIIFFNVYATASDIVYGPRGTIVAGTESTDTFNAMAFLVIMFFIGINSLADKKNKS